LDYIGRYEPINAEILCDRIEEIMTQTGQNGFHFVDEAAPPALMRDLAIEILRRGLTVVWWTNIRFESSFTAELCRLLRASGCIAVSGGLEVASDRLLELIKKGVTVSQVARVTNHFTQSGIMVHAYLMYGFPTQTAQETIDSLEMVRQLFETGVLQSGFWHRFAMTVHSPVGINPNAFAVKTVSTEGSFANNELQHEDPTGGDHDLFGEGLRKSLFNYMHGVGFEIPLKEWFDSKVPNPTVAKDYILKELEKEESLSYKDQKRIIWIGEEPELLEGENEGFSDLIFSGKKEDFAMELPTEFAEWVLKLLQEVSYQQNLKTIKTIREWYEADLGEFEELHESEVWEILLEQGLLIL
jgi:hypothetical protein